MTSPPTDTPTTKAMTTSVAASSTALVYLNLHLRGWRDRDARGTPGAMTPRVWPAHAVIMLAMLISETPHTERDAWGRTLTT